MISQKTRKRNLKEVHQEEEEEGKEVEREMVGRREATMVPLDSGLRSRVCWQQAQVSLSWR